MSRCTSCDGRILWARTPKGKLIPLDPLPDPRGNMVLEGTTARVATAADFPLDGPRYMPHWATCPDGEYFRRPR